MIHEGMMVSLEGGGVQSQIRVSYPFAAEKQNAGFFIWAGAMRRREQKSFILYTQWRIGQKGLAQLTVSSASILSRN